MGLNISSNKNSTVISNCTCKHEYQDNRYGKGKRVFNIKTTNNGATCTVCGTSKTV